MSERKIKVWVTFTARGKLHAVLTNVRQGAELAKVGWEPGILIVQKKRTPILKETT